MEYYAILNLTLSQLFLKVTTANCYFKEQSKDIFWAFFIFVLNSKLCVFTFSFTKFIYLKEYEFISISYKIYFFNFTAGPLSFRPRQHYDALSDNKKISF